MFHSILASTPSVGKAGSLHGGITDNHRSLGKSMTNSALRRNVAEALGVATAADIKSRHYRTTADDAARVTQWLNVCQIAWIECTDEAAAVSLETNMKLEWMPPLTKR